MPATPISTEQELDDDALVGAVCRGDVQSYCLLFKRHAESLHVYVAFRVWIPHLVAETVHETFVWAYRHLDQFQPGTSFQAWLRAIAWNLARAELQRFAREHKRRENYLRHRLTLECLAAGENSDCAELDTLRECLGRLKNDARHQQIIHLRYHEGLTSREIAPLVAHSPVWVRVTLHRIVQQLRTCIGAKTARPPC